MRLPYGTTSWPPSLTVRTCTKSSGRANRSNRDSRVRSPSLELIVRRGARRGHPRCAPHVVRGESPRSPLAPHPRSLSHPRFRSHAAADPGRSGHPLLRAVSGAPADGRSARRRADFCRYHALGGARIQPPRRQSPAHRASGDGSLRRRLPERPICSSGSFPASAPTPRAPSPASHSKSRSPFSTPT